VLVLAPWRERDVIGSRTIPGSAAEQGEAPAATGGRAG